MARYIDADAFKKKLIDEKNFFPAIVARALEEMPTADVVEVVRCENCEYSKEYPMVIMCRKFGRDTTKNDFCSGGERKGK